MRLENAVSVFANCGRAVAHVRGSYGPIADVAPSFDAGKHEGLLGSLFRIVPAYPHIR